MPYHNVVGRLRSTAEYPSTMDAKQMTTSYRYESVYMIAASAAADTHQPA